MTMYTKVKEAVKKIGEERVMYGSDYPFGDAAIEVRRITAAGLTKSQLERVFYANAKRLFSP
jgi:hypothetical protein